MLAPWSVCYFAWVPPFFADSERPVTCVILVDVNVLRFGCVVQDYPEP